MIWQNIFSVRENFLFFHTAKCGKFGNFPPIFRQIDLHYNSLVKKLIWRNFSKKLWGKNLQISTLCTLSAILRKNYVKSTYKFSKWFHWKLQNRLFLTKMRESLCKNWNYVLFNNIKVLVLMEQLFAVMAGMSIWASVSAI